MAEQSTQGPKVRASCDRCQASKVKCSRNKPSCWRCSQAGIPCVYGPFRRIGRPPKQPATKTTPPAAGAFGLQRPTGEEDDGHRRQRGRNPKKRVTRSIDNRRENEADAGDDGLGYPVVNGQLDLFLSPGEPPAEDMAIAPTAVDQDRMGLPYASLVAWPSTDMLSMVDTVLGMEPASSETWDVTTWEETGSLFRNPTTRCPASRLSPSLDHHAILVQQSVPSNAQPSPHYSASSTKAFWQAGSEPHSSALKASAISACADTNNAAGLYSFNWFGTTSAVAPPPTPPPSSSSTSQQTRAPFWWEPQRAESTPSTSGGAPSSTPAGPRSHTGGTYTAASGHITPPPHVTTHCASNCYAALSTQLASLTAPDLNFPGIATTTSESPAGVVPLDALLSLDCAAHAAQKQTLSCERCMSGANSQTTLLLLAMAVEKLVGLFETWVEHQGPSLLKSSREWDSNRSSSSGSNCSDGDSWDDGTGWGVCGRAEENTGKASLLAGNFAVEGKVIKGEFLTRLLVLRIDRLGEMVIELMRGVETGSHGKGVGSKVAGEMLHDVGRRIFFLKGKVTLSV